ncbi:hypothetical protein ACFULT_02210 [Rhodococcus sp. NPDC057297]|uniref:hypothetical protein n=1 Tax=Rhodococcus sp. NPDC057297 TaxID=3346090 RepID=UPI00362E4D59
MSESRSARRASTTAVVVAMILLAALGGACIVLGGADDSPGLQGIGVVAVIAALVVSVRSTRRA